MANEKITKVGFSVKNDIQALNRTFNNLLEFKEVVGIDDLLFLAKNTSKLGLSTICKRYYGKPMNKEA